MVADKIEALLADKGYDADAIREELAKAEIEAVIPAKRNRKNPAPHDAEKYKWRNLIERLCSVPAFDGLGLVLIFLDLLSIVCR